MGVIRLLLASAVLLSASTAFARADIEVSIIQPAVIDVDQSARIEVDVANIGNRNASDVELYIQLPETATSPTVHIMGVLGGFSSDCSMWTDTILRCDLGRVRKNRTKTVFFEIALPSARTQLQFLAEARTSSREDDVDNNADLVTAQITYVDTPIAAPVLITNRHCTGQGLTAFFECTLYPSSISSHQVVLEATNNEISFPNGPATMSGEWAQPNPFTLHFVYRDNGNIVAAFAGYGVGGNCFEGLTVFPGSPWVAPYEVCL